MTQLGYITLCRTAVSADGWYHIMPVGEYPAVAHGPDGKTTRITEVIDATALARIMADFEARRRDPEWPGYLVCQEHFSQDEDKSSEAYGWARELQVRNGPGVPERERGVWARIEKTELGERVIGTVYKFFSAVNSLERIDGDRMRPINIDDIGLTNKPAFRNLVPAMHRDRNDKETTMLDRIRELFAKHKITLADNADEQVVVTALDAALGASAQVPDLTQRAETAEHRVVELEKAETERKADDFVAKHKDKVKDEGKLRALFVEHRELADEMIVLIKDQPAKPAQKVLHRDGAGTPDGQAAAGNTDADADAAEKRAARSREQTEYVQQIRSVHHLPTFDAAWTMARRIKPELFKEEKPAAE